MNLSQCFLIQFLFFIGLTDRERERKKYWESLGNKLHRLFAAFASAHANVWQEKRFMFNTSKINRLYSCNWSAGRFKITYFSIRSLRLEVNYTTARWLGGVPLAHCIYFITNSVRAAQLSAVLFDASTEMSRCMEKFVKNIHWSVGTSPTTKRKCQNSCV